MILWRSYRAPMELARMDDPMKEVVELLQADRKASSPRYPTQALPAVLDARVAEALGLHLAAGARLVDVRALPYQATLGLIPIVFELEPSGRVALRRSSVLVLMDGRSEVVAVNDDFDVDRPNPSHAPAGSVGAQPFTLLDESAASTMSFTNAELGPVWERTSTFLRGAVPTFRGGAGGGDRVDTFCPENTVVGTSLMAVATVSGGLFFTYVDDHRTLVQPDNSVDMVTDDSEVIVEPL
jgi:hypothetical protein